MFDQFMFDVCEEGHVSVNTEWCEKCIEEYEQYAQTIWENEVPGHCRWCGDFHREENCPWERPQEERDELPCGFCGSRHQPNESCQIRRAAEESAEKAHRARQQEQARKIRDRSYVLKGCPDCEHLNIACVCTMPF